MASGSTSAGPREPTGLGQLASIFEAIARLGPGDELHGRATEVLEARRELEEGLARRREYEQQLRDARAELERLRNQWRQVECDASGTQRRIAHAQNELGTAGREARRMEEDVQSMRGFVDEGRHGLPRSPLGDDRRDVASDVAAEREMLQHEKESIEDIRVKLHDVVRQKLEAQAAQHALMERKRQSEQDRELMHTAIMAECGKLDAMRAERIGLSEERCALVREIAEIQQRHLLTTRHRAPGKDVPNSWAGHHAAVVARGAPGAAWDERPAVVYGDQDRAGGFDLARNGPAVVYGDQDRAGSFDLARNGPLRVDT